MQDLESRLIYTTFSRLQQSITDTHRLVNYARQARHPLQKAVYQLNAMLQYCQAVESASLPDLLREVRSEGLKKLLKHVQTMVAGYDYLEFTRAGSLF